MMLDSSLGKILSTKPAEPSIPPNKQTPTETNATITTPTSTTTTVTTTNTNIPAPGAQGEEAAGASVEEDPTPIHTIATTTTHATTTTNIKSEAEVRLVVRFFVEEQIVFNGKIEKVKQLESEELSRIVSRIAWESTREGPLDTPPLDTEPIENDKVIDRFDQDERDRNNGHKVGSQDQQHRHYEFEVRDTTKDNRTNNEDGNLMMSELMELHDHELTGVSLVEERATRDSEDTHLLNRHEEIREETFLDDSAQEIVEQDEAPIKDEDEVKTTVEIIVEEQVKDEQIVEIDFAEQNIHMTAEQTIAQITNQVLEQENSVKLEDNESLVKIQPSQQYQEILEESVVQDFVKLEEIIPPACEKTLQDTSDIDCSKTGEQPNLTVPNSSNDKERRSSRVSSVDRQVDTSSSTTRIEVGAVKINVNDDHSTEYLARHTKVFAKWSDNHFYPGTIMKTRERKYEIKFFDGPHKVLIETDLIPLSNIVTKQIRVSISRDYCVNAIVYGQTTDNGQHMFDVEYQQNGRVRKWVPLHDIFLTAEQGLPLINQLVRVDKNPDDTMFAGVDLDNIVHNKRSRRLQEMEDLGFSGENSGQQSGSTTPTAGGTNTSPATGGRRKRGQYNMRTTTNRARNLGNARAEVAHERGLKRSHSDVNNQTITPASSCSPDNLKPHLHPSNSNPPSESSSSTGSTNSVLNAHEMGQDFYFESTSPHRTKTSLLL